MKPFYQEDGMTILQGDCREILPTLPDQSVNCCVTSPPYWGLRDYGTAKWEGGEASCSHRNAHSVQGQTGQRADRSFTGSQNFYRDVCAKCGARRTDNQLGLEPTPEEYVSRIVKVFREVRRVLRDDGTLWLNLGDSYANDGKWRGETGGKQFYLGEANRRRVGREQRITGLKPKDLIGIPWRVAFALQADGWYLRSDIIWHKPNPMPESVTDRPTKAHEYLFLLSRRERYYYDAEAIAERAVQSSGGWQSRARAGLGTASVDTFPCGDRRDGGVCLGARRIGEIRNKRSVWTVATEPYQEAHFSTFPRELIEPCIKAGCPTGGTVLDPFGGSGTTMQVARALGCRGLMIELNPDYCRLSAKRLRQAVLPLAETPDNIIQECRQETKDLFEADDVA